MHAEPAYSGNVQGPVRQTAKVSYVGAELGKCYCWGAIEVLGTSTRHHPSALSCILPSCSLGLQDGSIGIPRWPAAFG
jgi:hypothetical protein